MEECKVKQKNYGGGVLLRGVGELRASQQLQDVLLVCEGGAVLRAHSAVLAAASKFFRTLLLENSVWSTRPTVVELPQTCARLLGALVDFMYSGEASVQRGELKLFIELAQALQVNALCLKDAPPHNPRTCASETSPGAAPLVAPDPTPPHPRTLHPLQSGGSDDAEPGDEGEKSLTEDWSAPWETDCCSDESKSEDSQSTDPQRSQDSEDSQPVGLEQGEKSPGESESSLHKESAEPQYQAQLDSMSSVGLNPQSPVSTPLEVSAEPVGQVVGSQQSQAPWVPSTCSTVISVHSADISPAPGHPEVPSTVSSTPDSAPSNLAVEDRDPPTYRISLGKRAGAALEIDQIPRSAQPRLEPAAGMSKFCSSGSLYSPQLSNGSGAGSTQGARRGAGGGRGELLEAARTSRGSVSVEAEPSGAEQVPARRGGFYGGRFHCHFCDKSYTQRHNLSTHISTMHCNRRFPCAVCGNSFTRRGILKSHERAVHNDNDGVAFPPYTCDVCQKSYKLKSSLRVHIWNSHLHPTRHVCGTCGKDYKRRGTLLLHERNAHGEHSTPRPCPQCGKVMKNKQVLAMHMIKAHHVLKTRTM